MIVGCSRAVSKEAFWGCVALAVILLLALLILSPHPSPFRLVYAKLTGESVEFVFPVPSRGSTDGAVFLVAGQFPNDIPGDAKGEYREGIITHGGVQYEVLAAYTRGSRWDYVEDRKRLAVSSFTGKARTGVLDDRTVELIRDGKVLVFWAHGGWFRAHKIMPEDWTPF